MTERDDRTDEPDPTEQDSVEHDADHREPPAEHPQQDSESRLDHVDHDTQITPDKVKRKQDRD